MAMPALKFETEKNVEERVLVLEAHIEHIRSDISDMKVDIRRIGDRISSVDDKLTAKIDTVDQKLTGEIRAVDAKLTAEIRAVDAKLTGEIRAVDAKLTAKIDAVDQKLTEKIDAVDQKLTEKIDAVDQKLTAKIDAVDQKLTGKIEAVKDSVAQLALTMEKCFGALRTGRMVDRVWWLLMSGALLGVMGRAFKWL